MGITTHQLISYQLKDLSLFNILGFLRYYANKDNQTVPTIYIDASVVAWRSKTKTPELACLNIAKVFSENGVNVHIITDPDCYRHHTKVDSTRRFAESQIARLQSIAIRHGQK